MPSPASATTTPGASCARSLRRHRDRSRSRELNGLTLYRLGKWRDAIKELEQFRLLTNSTEQHPVLADSYRALGRYAEVEELWSELREASPNAALVAEGRIVMAGSLADRDRLADAVRLMEQGVKFPRRVQDHHLRMWYALADLYERAGDMVKFAAALRADRRRQPRLRRRRDPPPFPALTYLTCYEENPRPFESPNAVRTRVSSVPVKPSPGLNGSSPKSTSTSSVVPPTPSGPTP